MLEEKFIENQNAIAKALIDASLKANTAAVRETVKLVDSIADPEEKPTGDSVTQIQLWETELNQE